MDPLPADPEIAFAQKTLITFIAPDGSFRAIPAQQKKLLVLLRHCLQAFAPGQRYTEPEVNAILLRYHPDTAFLRRSLIVHGMMDREDGGGAYWRVDGLGGDQAEGIAGM